MFEHMPVIKHTSTKKYDHNAGLSVAFRQWRADSHCHYIHGYSIAVELVFVTLVIDYENGGYLPGGYEFIGGLDARNWVTDFGGLKEVKGNLERLLDHKTLVAEDDPQIEYLRKGHDLGVLDLVELEHVGCEKLAEFIHKMVQDDSKLLGFGPRCILEKVQVWEHSGNSAAFERPVKLDDFLVPIETQDAQLA